MKRLFFLLVLLGILTLILAGCTNISRSTKSSTSSNQVQSITVEELKGQLVAGIEKDTIIVDLREPVLYNKGHIQGAILMPFADFEKQYTQLEQNKRIILACHTGSMGEASGQFLISMGYTRVYNLVGGMRAWREKRKLHSLAPCNLFAHMLFSTL